MKKIKWDDLVVTFIVGFICGLITCCFSSPSSEARLSSLGSGFFENNAGCTSGLSDVSHKHGFAGPNPAPAIWVRQSRVAVNDYKETAIDSTDNTTRGEYAYAGLCSPRNAFIVTAYCPCSRCCGKFSDGVTASGHIIKEDDLFVAAPASFPFGTILDIPTYGKVPVLDRGGAIKGNRLDVFFATHQQALNWGVKYLEVERFKNAR